MKRVLIFAAHFHPYKGGLENFALDLGTLLAKKNIQVDVFTYNLDNLKDYETYKGINIIRFPCKSILGQTYTLPKFNKKYSEMLKTLLKNDYDAVFTNTRFFTTSFLGMRYAKKMKKRNENVENKSKKSNKSNKKPKFIHIEHGNVHVIHANPIVTFIAWLYDQTAGRMIFSASDLTVGISNPCSNFAKKLGAKKTMTIYNSIDTKAFKKTNNKTNIALRNKIGALKNDFIIINGIGRLIYAKGLQDTMNAVKGLNDVFVINIGSGPFREDLTDLSKKLNIKSYFTGRINQKEVIEYLNISDIFINPSYSEGLPTCVLEAGAMGLPVIATNVGGTKEIISDSSKGYLIKPKDIKEIRKIIMNIKKDKNPALKKGANLKKNIKETFDWKKNIDKFEGLF